MKNNYVILSNKIWNCDLAEILSRRYEANWSFLSELNVHRINDLNPSIIFVVNWSEMIAADIIERFPCIVFHETDLPFGRGGSPIQNLICRGIKNTKISALKATLKVDAGPVYLKKDLPLYGTIEEIGIRSNDIVADMIVEILQKKISPKTQKGEITKFKRRKPSDGILSSVDSLDKAYDLIRMLDGEGYPNAFLETESFRLEFSRASIKCENEIIADVRITKK